MFELYFNQRIKTYPSGMQVITTFNKPIFNPLHHKRDAYDREVDDALPFVDYEPDPNDNPIIRNRLDNIKRSREKIFDIAYLNTFDWFITLTFNDAKVNAYDENAVHKTMSRWFSNMVNRHNLKYLAVPEYHPSSGRIHWHMLASGDLTMVDSGTVLIPEREDPVRREYAEHICHDMSKARTVYNMREWRNGFSTCIKFQKCDDGGDGTSAIAKYMTKYITKDLALTKVLKTYYYAGGHLVRDVPTEYKNVCYELVDALPYSCVSDLSVKYQTIGVIECENLK